MAHIIRCLWRAGPRQVRRVAWGFTLQVNGKQIRKVNSAWSEADARRAMAAAILADEADDELPHAAPSCVPVILSASALHDAKGPLVYLLLQQSRVVYVGVSGRGLARPLAARHHALSNGAIDGLV